VNYQEWERDVPETITGDSLWKMKAYRLALFAAEMGWHDVTKLIQDRRTIGLSNQLYRALGSVGADLAEGYSRGTGRDRPERAGAGTSKAVTFWVRPSCRIVCNFLLRLFACC
jgi:hypothetical protein